MIDDGEVSATDVSWELVVFEVVSSSFSCGVVTDDVSVSIANETIVMAVSEFVFSVDAAVICASEVSVVSLGFLVDNVAKDLSSSSDNVVFVDSTDDPLSLLLADDILNAVTDEVAVLVVSSTA